MRVKNRCWFDHCGGWRRNGACFDKETKDYDQRDWGLSLTTPLPELAYNLNPAAEHFGDFYDRQRLIHNSRTSADEEAETRPCRSA